MKAHMANHSDTLINVNDLHVLSWACEDANEPTGEWIFATRELAEAQLRKWLDESDYCANEAEIEEWIEEVRKTDGCGDDEHHFWIASAKVRTAVA